MEATPRTFGPGAGRPPRKSVPPTYAAVDLGSHNCRLLIARPAGDRFHVVDAFSRIVRLGEGVEAHGRLSDRAIERALKALRVCASKIRTNKAVRARAVATEACRRASNGAAFIERVRRETGLHMEIISAHEEARLAVDGCRPLLDGTLPHGLMFDIGGGSTELVWMRGNGDGRHEVLANLSVPAGVVGFAERYGGDRFSRAGYRAMVADVTALLAPFEETHGIARRVGAGGVQLLGTSGTVTTLASIHLGLRRYDRAAIDGTYMSFEAARDVRRRLVALDFDGRAAVPCVGRARADLVVAGAAILEAICRLWPVGRFRVADRGLRDGILLGLMAVDRNEIGAPKRVNGRPYRPGSPG